MRQRNFKQVDVFTATPYRGNPVAVVLDAEGLETSTMQRIARWTNLSETTFVLAPQHARADYSVRIFTPLAELPFAGHPTLGTAHALIESGFRGRRDGQLVQHCAAGLIEVERDDSSSRSWLTLPASRAQALDGAASALLSRALGTDVDDAERIDLGPIWITAKLRSAEAVLSLAPDRALLSELSTLCAATGVTVFGEHDGSHARYEVRSFAPAHGVDEDPVCGSGNGCVASYLAGRGMRDDYLARQGRAVGRDGEVAVRYRDDGSILIGGASVTCVDGKILA